jgi:hypothetical protein
LWSAWKKLRDEGVPPVRGANCSTCSCHVLTFASLFTSASFALTTCYTNQLRMTRSR